MNSTSNLYHGWKPSPDAGRGTLGLLYSCGLTIFICCWSSLHMNVPGDVGSKVTRFGRQLKWMLICIVAPEFLASIAMMEFLDARALAAEFANIPQLAEWSLVHGFLLSMGGISLQTACGRYFRPPMEHFLDLVKNGKVEVTGISKEDIEDKSKSSGIAKALTLVQILWFALGVLVRGIQHMPITTLELFTIAIIFCSILTYAFWWHKPRDVQRPFTFKLDPLVHLKDLEAKTKSDDRYEGLEAPGKRISLFDYNTRNYNANFVMMGICLIVALGFGPWHLFGWNIHFNTQAEQFLWRISSVGCSILPISMVFLMHLMGISLRFESSSVSVWLISVAFWMYIPIRLYLLGECLSNLRAVPVGVYEGVKWLDIIPHIGD
jgi:hypothetical protein